MAELVYDLGDLGPFQDVVEWTASIRSGWFLEVLTPGDPNAFNTDATWSDRLVYSRQNSGAVLLPSREFFALPLRNGLIVLNADMHVSRITESFDGIEYRSVQETIFQRSGTNPREHVQVIALKLMGDLACQESASVYFPRLFAPVSMNGTVPYGARYEQAWFAMPRTIPPIDYPLIPGTTLPIYSIPFPALVIAAEDDPMANAYIEVDFSAVVTTFIADAWWYDGCPFPRLPEDHWSRFIPL